MVFFVSERNILPERKSLLKQMEVLYVSFHLCCLVFLTGRGGILASLSASLYLTHTFFQHGRYQLAKQLIILVVDILGLSFAFCNQGKLFAIS